MLHELAYVSREAKRLSLKELEELLHQARTFNQQHDITGMLLYKDGYFAQVIEGQKETLENLFKKIKSDPRHTEVNDLHIKPKQGRAFDGWSMGIKVMDDMLDDETLNDFNDFMNPNADYQDLLERDKKVFHLLTHFKESY